MPKYFRLFGKCSKIFEHIQKHDFLFCIIYKFNNWYVVLFVVFVNVVIWGSFYFIYFVFFYFFYLYFVYFVYFVYLANSSGRTEHTKSQGTTSLQESQFEYLQDDHHIATQRRRDFATKAPERNRHLRSFDLRPHSWKKAPDGHRAGNTQMLFCAFLVCSALLRKRPTRVRDLHV